MSERQVGEAFEPARLLGGLGSAVIAADAAGVVRYWNEAAERLYGWTTAEALGARLTELTASGAARSFAAEVMAVLRAGGRWSGGLEVQRKDGSSFTAWVAHSAIYDEDGRVVGLVTAAADLGAVVRPLLARLNEASIVVGADATVHYWSPPAVAVFGWLANEIVGTSVLDLVHPDDREQVRHLVLEAASAATRLEFRLRARDDSWLWVDARVKDLREDPEVGGLVIMLSDVNERIQAHDRLRELTDQLQSALQSRVVIEQAKGALAQRLGVDPEQAFEWLRRRARQDQRRIDDVAAEVVAGLGSPSGDSPGPAGDTVGPLA